MSGTHLVARPSEGLHGPLRDLAAFARELLRPTLVTRATLDLATTTAFPGLAGVLPGVGRFDPLDWGLGFELRDGKDPHWTGSRNSPATFGHFGGSGTFLWVDPALESALACLTDRDYGPWALEAWPPFSDAVIAALAVADRDAAGPDPGLARNSATIMAAAQDIEGCTPSARAVASVVHSGHATVPASSIRCRWDRTFIGCPFRVRTRTVV